MAKKTTVSESSEKQRRHLVVPREEARQRIMAQMEKANTLPNVSINDNPEAHRWYDFTAELLKQLFTTDELSDEFVGLGSFYFGDDISVGHYLRRLTSIHERLDLYPEKIPTPVRDVSLTNLSRALRG